MKSVVILVLSGALLPAVASAKTVTVPQKDNDRVVAGVSGATPGKDKANTTTQGSTTQPGKKALKSSKVRTPPPMHDPN